jgi:predicted transcriptional regulator of viral defense system
MKPTEAYACKLPEINHIAIRLVYFRFTLTAYQRVVYFGGMSEAKKPNWNSLYQLALARGGFFRNVDAAEAGFSKQLLYKHVLAGRLERAMRGVYRLAHFPPGDQDELIGLWVWSDEAGVFSHETALSLHQLSDALPSRIHMTLPRSWERRAAVPPLLVLHHANVPESDRTWVGNVPVTTIGRTLRDAVDAGVDPDLIAQAIAQGTARKLVRREDVRGIVPPRRRPRRETTPV